ncbi:MAG: 50S ribosomal protein L16 3-hydroxylase [Myxococcota bacterium]|jgi:50S ribosomal protein L16 3-hydroxylase
MLSPLEAMFSPMSRSQFFEHYLGDVPVVVNDVQGVFSALTSLPFLTSLDDLFRVWPAQVSAYLPGTPDEVNSGMVSVADAKKVFTEEGRGLCFDDANRYCSEISEWLEMLKMDLGLSNLTISRSLIYATAKGKGTATHFDQNINFIYQVHGTKKWWVAPNTSVSNPMTRHTLGHPLDAELASYTENDMPEEMPDDAQEFLLEPGSLMFLPRGAWHKTEAISDAISLNFTYSAPTWIDILSAALRGRLAGSSVWRETASFVNDEDLHVQAIDKFDHLLGELAKEVPRWRAFDILGATESTE